MASGGGDRQMTKALPDIADVMKEGAANPSYTKLMRQLAMGSTIHLVSNCEDKTDWDVEDAAQFNLDNETTIIREGSNALETLDVGTTKGTFITMDEGHRPDNENWEEFGWLCMWVEDGTAVRLAGELTFQIKNAGTWSAETAVPVNSNADKYEYKCIDITGLDRGLVQGFRFVNQRGSGGSEKVYIDQIIVTDMITGVGDSVQAFTGPVWGGGCMIMTVATGQTLSGGEFVNFEKGEAHAGVQNDQAVVGAVCQTTDFNE